MEGVYIQRGWSGPAQEKNKVLSIMGPAQAGPPLKRALSHLSSPRSRRASDRSFCSSGPPVVASSSPPRAAASAGVSALSRRPASRRPCCCCVGPHPALRSAGRCPVGSAGPPRRRGAVSPSTGHASCGRITWTAEGLSGDFSGNSFSLFFMRIRNKATRVVSEFWHWTSMFHQ